MKLPSDLDRLFQDGPPTDGASSKDALSPSWEEYKQILERKKLAYLEGHTTWANGLLREHNCLLVSDLRKSIADGLTLINLVEIISLAQFRLWKVRGNIFGAQANEKVEGVNNKPILRSQKVDNLQKCVTFLEEKGADTQNISAEDLTDGNLKSTLVLMNNIRKKYDPQFNHRETADGSTSVSQSNSRPNSIAHVRYPSEPSAEINSSRGQGQMASINQGHPNSRTPPAPKRDFYPQTARTGPNMAPHNSPHQPSDIIPGTVGGPVNHESRTHFTQPASSAHYDPHASRTVNGVPQYYTSGQQPQPVMRPQSAASASKHHDDFIHKSTEPPQQAAQAWGANGSPTRSRHHVAARGTSGPRPAEQLATPRGYSNGAFDDEGELLIPPPPKPRDDARHMNNSMQNLTSYVPSTTSEKISGRGQVLATPPSPRVPQQVLPNGGSVPPSYNNPPQYSRPSVSSNETSVNSGASMATNKMSSSRTDIRSACNKLYTRDGLNFPQVAETNKYVGPGSQPYSQGRASPTGQSSSSPPGSHNSSHGNLSPVTKIAPPKPPHVADTWTDGAVKRNSGNYESLQRAVEYGGAAIPDPGSLTRSSNLRGSAHAVDNIEMRKLQSGGVGYSVNSNHYTNLNPSTVRSHSPDGRVAPPVLYDSTHAKTPTSMDKLHDEEVRYKSGRDASPVRAYQQESVQKSPAIRHHKKSDHNYVNMNGTQGHKLSSSRERIHSSKSTEDLSSKAQPPRQQGRSAQRLQKAMAQNKRQSVEDKSHWRDSLASESTSPSVTPPLPPLSPSNTPPHTPPGSPRRGTPSRHMHAEPLGYTNAGFMPSEPVITLPQPKSSRKKASRKSSSKTKRSAPGRPSHRNPYRALQASRNRANYMAGMRPEDSLLDDDSFDDQGSTTNASVTVTEGDMDTNNHEMQMVHRQLQGLETMYTEILKLLGVDREYLPGSRRSVSSMSSTSRTGRSRRSHSSHRHRSRELKQINKRFARLESHVVTLARSVAHLSSEMRSQAAFYQEIDMLKQEVAELKSGRHPSSPLPHAGSEWDKFRGWMPMLTNPKRVEKLRRFFGAEPLLQIFLEKLGYKQYIPNFESEKISILELPYMNEERLERIGIPLGPRQRILQEAQMCFRQENFNIYIV